MTKFSTPEKHRAIRLQITGSHLEATATPLRMTIFRMKADTQVRLYFQKCPKKTPLFSLFTLSFHT